MVGFYRAGMGHMTPNPLTWQGYGIVSHSGGNDSLANLM